MIDITAHIIVITYELAVKCGSKSELTAVRISEKLSLSCSQVEHVETSTVITVSHNSYRGLLMSVGNFILIWSCTLHV